MHRACTAASGCDACPAPRPPWQRQGKPARRPIDFVAASITGVLSNHRSGCGAYHVVNPHCDDGASLDALVDWMAEARGGGVRRIQDYAQWCARSWAAPVMALWGASVYMC